MWKLLKILDFSSVGLGRHVWGDSELSTYIIDKINNGVTSENLVNILNADAPEGFIYRTAWPVGTTTYEETTEQGTYERERTYQYNDFIVEFPELNGNRVGIGNALPNYAAGPYFETALNRYQEYDPNTGNYIYHYEDRYTGAFLQPVLANENGGSIYQFFGSPFMYCYEQVEKYGTTQTRVYTPDDVFTVCFFIVDEDAQKLAWVTAFSTQYNSVELKMQWYTSVNGSINLWDWLSPFIGSETPEDWEPIPQITGNGVTTPLAKIRPDWIRGGQPQSDAPNTRFDLVGIWGETSADLTGLINGMEVNETREKVLYSGANYLSITKDSGDAVAWTATLNFYNAEDVLIYSWQYNKVLGGSLYLSAIRKSGEEVVHLSCIQSDGSVYSYNQEVCSASDEAALYQWFIGEGETPDPYKEDVIDDPQGGITFFPRPTDKIGRGDIPNVNGLESGFFHAYAPTEGAIAQMAGELWNPTFWDEIKDQYQSPADVVIGAYILPVTPPASHLTPDETHITAGKVNFTATAKELTERYYVIDFGHIDMLPHWDSYHDFGKYTRVRLYLPFIGEVDLNTDEIMAQIENVKGSADIVGVGCALGLSYQFDLLTGIVSALLFVNGSLMYQWTGTAKIDLPISWRTNTQATNETLSFVKAIGGAVIAGAGLALAPLTGSASAVIGAKIGAGVAAGGLIKSGADMALAEKYGQETHTNGAVGGLAGAMDCKYPYITITTPRVVLPASEENYTGMASFTQSKIGEFATSNGYVDAEGVVVAKSVQLEGDCGTQTERDEIMTYLEGGVLL